MTEKQALRQLIRLRKQQKHHADESVVILNRLRQEEHISRAHTLLLYSALSDEVQIQPLLDELVHQGKTILLPRVTSDTEMELRRYTGQQDLTPGAFGILEPNGELFTQYDSIEVAVIPGMAFDNKGHRLGRGRGYYDRFLARITDNVFKIGVCFPWQFVDAVPADDHDVSMNLVIC